MSEERQVISVPLKGVASTKELTKEDIQAQRVRMKEKKARFARVLERGFTVDRLTVELPGDKWGEWVADNDVEIMRKKALGFTIDTEYAAKRSLHSDGTGAPIVGDVIFMIQSREDHEILDELYRENYIRMHGSPEQKKQLEDSDYESSLAMIPEVPVINESVARDARKEQINEALKTT